MSGRRQAVVQQECVAANGATLIYALSPVPLTCALLPLLTLSAFTPVGRLQQRCPLMSALEGLQELRAGLKGRVLLPDDDAAAFREALSVWAVGSQHAAGPRPAPAVVVQPRGKQPLRPCGGCPFLC